MDTAKSGMWDSDRAEKSRNDTGIVDETAIVDDGQWFHNHLLQQWQWLQTFWNILWQTLSKDAVVFSAGVGIQLNTKIFHLAFKIQLRPFACVLKQDRHVCSYTTLSYLSTHCTHTHMLNSSSSSSIFISAMQTKTYNFYIINLTKPGNQKVKCPSCWPPIAQTK